MSNPHTNHLFRQQAKLCSKPHQQVVPPLVLTDPSLAAITEVLMGRNKAVWLLLLIRAVYTSVIGPWRVPIIVPLFATVQWEWVLSSKALIALVKKEELDCGDPDIHINHGIALSLCCGYGLETALVIFHGL